jgi:SAM-dependent methyltransferase
MAETRVDAAAFNAFEAAGWEKHAAGYHDFFRPIIARFVEPLLDAANVGPGTRVLDAGCGPGYVSAKAAERGAVTIGVDNAEAMIAIARRSYPSLEFHRGDVEAIAFPEQSFDAVVGCLIMLHLGRPELAASEFARVLVPNGRLALTVWDFAERARVFGGPAVQVWPIHEIARRVLGNAPARQCPGNSRRAGQHSGVHRAAPTP